MKYSKGKKATFKSVGGKLHVDKVFRRKFSLLEWGYVVLSHTCAFIRAIARRHKNDIVTDIAFCH